MRAYIWRSLASADGGGCWYAEVSSGGHVDRPIYIRADRGGRWYATCAFGTREEAMAWASERLRDWQEIEEEAEELRAEIDSPQKELLDL